MGCCGESWSCGHCLNLGCCGESWSCGHCLNRCFCKPFELMSYKEDPNLVTRLEEATKEEMATKHKIRSFRKGNARMGFLVHSGLGLLAPCCCYCAVLDSRQEQVAVAEQIKIEEAAKAKHGVDLRYGEDRVRRKRHLLGGALMRVVITAACCFVGEWVNDCATFGVTAAMESVGTVVTEGGIETTACKGAKPGLSTGVAYVAEKVYRCCVWVKSDDDQQPKTGDTPTDNDKDKDS